MQINPEGLSEAKTVLLIGAKMKAPHVPSVSSQAHQPSHTRSSLQLL